VYRFREALQLADLKASLRIFAWIVYFVFIIDVIVFTFTAFVKLQIL